MEFEGKLSSDDISKYERDVREPSLLTILRYAQVAEVCVDVLINDDLNLPKNLPSLPRHNVHNRASKA